MLRYNNYRIPCNDRLVKLEFITARCWHSLKFCVSNYSKMCT